MKVYIQMIGMISMLLASQLSMAANESAYDDDTDTFWKIADYKKNVPVIVTVAGAVPNKITQLPSADAKRVKEAIKIGAIFMERYLDGFVSDMNPTWHTEMAALVGSENTWAFQEITGLSHRLERTDGVNKYWVEKLMCSQANLIDFKFENSSLILIYQMTQLGTMSYDNHDHGQAFIPGDSGTKELFNLYINNENKIFNILPADREKEESYLAHLFELNLYVSQFPKHVIEKKYLDKKLLNQKLIQQIVNQAEKVCKSRN
jgi:hypothetical protein